jgi:hypothetical protein
MESSASQDVQPFGREFGEGGDDFSRIGAGLLGGKATGLLRIRDEILQRLEADSFPYITVVVPTLTVLTTDLFSAFMEQNKLFALANSELSDDRIAHAFQRAELPAEYVGDLRALIARVHTPLAIRSSSLLEDALDHPFAGVYLTKMVPNNEIEEDARFRRLTEAIKFVYASTFFSEAKAYSEAIGAGITEERMAVIVQEIVGQRTGDRYYPCVSGVARSHNFYPSGSAKPSEGVVHLALGLGKTIVDGGMSWSISPYAPTAPPPFNNIGALLKNTQTTFWAVHMGEAPLPDPIRETECLVECSLPDAEADGALKFLASTYDSSSDRLNPGLGGHGPRALTFAPLLGSRFAPINSLIQHLLQLSKDVVGTDVEIEFAVSLHREDLLPARFGFLQVRPMMVGGEAVQVTDEEMFGEGVLVSAADVLGNGRRDGICDVVYLKPGRFDPDFTLQMAKELEIVNRELVSEGRHYLLIGFGRWDSSDARMGVPIVWGQISGARVIVEATLPEVDPALSQGSHFFHNLLSFQVLYLSVPHSGPHEIDWTWLDGHTPAAETHFVRHLRLTEALEIRVDGSSRRGVITHHG